jgi:formamidopyrimidine-DNA glycosylase
MNSKNVVGVGNIYASEALYLAGIRPTMRATRVQKYRFVALVDVVKKVIGRAIESGGTTLQDYRNANGEVGGFQDRLQVYGREGSPCFNCGVLITKVVIAQRSTFFCSACQRG